MIEESLFVDLLAIIIVGLLEFVCGRSFKEVFEFLGQMARICKRLGLLPPRIYEAKTWSQ